MRRPPAAICPGRRCRPVAIPGIDAQHHDASDGTTCPLTAGEQKMAGADADHAGQQKYQKRQTIQVKHVQLFAANHCGGRCRGSGNCVNECLAHPDAVARLQRMCGAGTRGKACIGGAALLLDGVLRCLTAFVLNLDLDVCRCDSNGGQCCSYRCQKWMASFHVCRRCQEMKEPSQRNGRPGNAVACLKRGLVEADNRVVISTDKGKSRQHYSR